MTNKKKKHNEVGILDGYDIDGYDVTKREPSTHNTIDLDSFFEAIDPTAEDRFVRVYGIGMTRRLDGSLVGDVTVDCDVLAKEEDATGVYFVDTGRDVKLTLPSMADRANYVPGPSPYVLRKPDGTNVTLHVWQYR